MNPWMSAAIAAGAGVLVGAIAARVVRSLAGRSSHPSVSQVAGPIASVVFAVGAIIGLVVAVGFVQPGSLDTIPADLVVFLPRAVAAAVVAIAGNVVAALARAATARALRGTGAVEKFVPTVVYGGAIAFTVVLAAAQLGVDTTIINIAAAAVMFGTALTVALLIGLGGRQVASEVAAGRAWRSSLHVGDRVRVSGLAVPVEGVVTQVTPTSIEIESGSGKVLVPNSSMLAAVVERPS